MENVNKVSEYPKKYSCNFIEPGVISYQDVKQGMCYVPLEALDKFAKTLEGRPVVMKQNHVEGTEPKDFEDIAVGLVTNVYKKNDNWYWCDFYLWDDAARDQVEKEKYSVSCTYKINDALGAGVHNNVEYDLEVKDGEMTHLAIVPNPRYNEAKILLNSIQGGLQMKWFKNPFRKEVKNEISDKDELDVDGNKVPVSELVKTYQAEQAETAEKEKLGEKKEESEIGEDSTVKIGDKEVTLKDLANCYRKASARKNEEADAKAKKEAEEKAASEKKNADEAEAKKAEEAKLAKEAEVKKNAEDAKVKEEEEKKGFEEANKNDVFDERNKRLDARYVALTDKQKEEYRRQTHFHGEDRARALDIAEEFEVKKNAEDAKVKEEEEKKGFEEAKNSLESKFWTEEMKKKYSEVYNSLSNSAEGKKYFLKLKEAANSRNNNGSTILTSEDKYKRGQDEYGSKK